MAGIKSFSRIETDETLMERARHGSADFPFQYYYEDIWDFDLHCVDWHWHPELEVVFVRTGRALCLIGEDRVELSPGQGILINSRVMHRFETDGSTVIPNAVFSPALLAAEESLLYMKYIRPYLTGGPAFQTFISGIPWQAVCLQKLLDLFALQEREEADEWRTVRCLMDFWETLTGHTQLNTGTQSRSEHGTNLARLQVMMQFIQEHYREPLRLEEIAGSVFVGRSTALQIFQQGIHISPVAYLIQYRLRQAAMLLASTEKTVSAICEETGFQSAGYFCRKFRALYGVTPQTYRNQKKS